ncbi:MAG: prolipoprotein diacylglyceryl transferase [Thermoflexales bacterium]|nr:prolipoprotein diacylglyceryl transferase [Thermoflexales bacterium]MDW8352506.1 prolipoprotein diacylglyceryl transferase [Anaerolineae bacterium]
MPPQFVSLGPFTLNLYTLLIVLATLAPPVWAWFRTRDGRIALATSVVAFGALAFGRAGYVALHWDYFRDHSGEILALAGLSEHAAVIGGLIAARSLRAVPCLSGMRHSLLTAQFILVGIAASIGCIPNGCAYGREVFWQTDGEHSLAWLLRADWPDAYTIQNPRWPTQALMALWLAAIGVVHLILEARHRSGSCFPHLLGLLGCASLGDFLIQFLRGDPAPMLAGLRLYQWLDLLSVAWCTAMLLVIAARAYRDRRGNRSAC